MIPAESFTGNATVRTSGVHVVCLGFYVQASTTISCRRTTHT